MVSKTKSDHALAIFKAAVSAAPVVGGPIANLISDYIPSATEKSLNRAAELLEKRLKEFEDRLDPSNVNKDHFAELFKSSYLSIVRSHNDEKLRAATNLIANILLKDGDIEKLSYTELDHFARCVENLSSGAIEVLSVAFKKAEKSKKKDILTDGSYVIYTSDLKAQFSDITLHLLMGLIGELHSENLLRSEPPGFDVGIYPNYRIQLTPLGLRFVKYILTNT